MKFMTFGLLWIFIGAVSAYDAYFTVKYPPTRYSEQNPLARFLLGSGDVETLIGFKFLGTMLALGILATLYAKDRRLAFACAVPTAAFQCWFLYYIWS